jgi:iron complex outermembrane receptor protein
MTRISQARMGLMALLLCSVPTLTLAQDGASRPTVVLDPVLLMLKGLNGPATTTFSPRELYLGPASDGGAMLSTLPGVTASRMGGFGLDVVIRGQQGNQLNIIDAGSFTYGGCPNRMDPPASIAAYWRADEVVVERGYSSVTNGPGGSGGTVRLEREAPEFTANKRLTGNYHVGASGNGGGTGAGGELSYDLGNGFYVEGGAEYRTADDYKDGSGRTVRSGFTQKSTGLTFGYNKDGVDLALDIDHDRAEDVLYAGAGMDSPYSDTTTFRLRGGVDLDMGALKRVEGTLFVSNVDHLMDNYSLRPNAGMMVMASPTTSDTHGGKLEAQFEFGRTKARIGIDHQSNSRFAMMISGSRAVVDAGSIANATMLNWPDVTIAQTGLYAETETGLSQKTTLKLGLRYDHVKASAASAAGKAGFTGTAPNTWYNLQYGTTFNDPRSEDNLGGLARLEYEVAPDMVLFAGLSRSVRTADTNERGMARGSMGTPSWVGNPDIAPEKHHQFDLGIDASGDNWGLTASAYVDQVDDYILRDQFSYSGRTIYRNVSAQLSGVELSGSWSQDGLTLGGDLTWTRGQNQTDDRPLAQIPPLMGHLSAAYGKDAWQAGLRVNWAQGQDRIDPSRDPGATPGWATLDLFGSYAVNDKVVILAGVDNVFDKTYANHLARSNTFDTSVTQVNEPGRTIYIKLEAQF